MWPFKGDPQRQNAERLDKYLRRQIEEATSEFDKNQPSFLSQVFARKRKPGALEFRPIAVGGVNHALRSMVTSGPSPEAVVYNTAANVAIDLFWNYFKGVESGAGSKDSSANLKLSLHLVAAENVSTKLKDNVAKMRYSLQKSILLTAEYIEMQEFASLQEVINEGDDTRKNRKQIFVDSHYQLHVSYRSLAISLQLFSAINQELLRKIETERKSNPAGAHKFLVANAVFVYEIADLIITFLQAFELQGIPELKQLYEQTMAEIDGSRVLIDGLQADIEARANSGSVSILDLDGLRRSVRERSASVDLTESAWHGLMKKIEDAQNGSQTFRGFIADFEIIKKSADLNLRILDLMMVTKMVQDNIQKMQEMMLHVDKLRLPSITPDDVRRFFSTSPNPAGQPLINARGASPR